MRESSVNATSSLAVRCIAFLSSVSLLMAFVSLCVADDGTTKADALLDNLKRRSPEERWQRVKKLYPADPPALRPNSPARLPADHQQTLPDDGVPPSPEKSQLIPRLTALPMDTSNDWILPARPPVDDQGSVPAPLSLRSEDRFSADARPSRATVDIALQDTEMKSSTAAKNVAAPNRALRERQISEIHPYYDRDQDGDIREFAIRKGKELDIDFKPKSFSDRSFPEVTLAWEASNFTYHPLYFSDPALERYGHSHHPLLQPIASIARAGVQFIFLPYQMAIIPPCKEESPLGYYRPGDCVTKLHYQVPLNAEAAVVEAAALTGLFFMIAP